MLLLKVKMRPLKQIKKENYQLQLTQKKKKNYYIWLSKKRKKNHHSWPPRLPPTTTRALPTPPPPLLPLSPLRYHGYTSNLSQLFSIQSFYHIVTYPLIYITSIVTHLSSSTILYSVSTLSQYNYFFSPDSILYYDLSKHL